MKKVYFLLFYLFVYFSNTQSKFYENGTSSKFTKSNGKFLTSTKKIIDLSGNWEYSVDDKSTWNKIKIPSSYIGDSKIIFRKNFDLNNIQIQNYNISIVSFGINYFCEISINDNLIGRHIGGYTEFSFPIDKGFLQNGENTISIIVDNELNPKTTVPVRQQVGGWKNFGGIFRDIFLQLEPKLAIDEFKLSSKVNLEKESANLSGTVSISNFGYKTVSESKLHYLVCEMISTSDETNTAKDVIPFQFPDDKKNVEIKFNISTSIKLWSIENPNLYKVTFKIFSANDFSNLIDECYTEYGFKDLKVSENKFLLNGDELKINGIIYNEYHPKFGSALTYEVMENDIKMIKNLGVNLIRFVNKPPHPYFLSLCDKYGVLSLVEIPIHNVPKELFESEDFIATASIITKEVILQSNNYVSLFGYGVGDEFELENEFSNNFFKKIKSEIKKFNPQQFVYFVSSNYENELLLESDFVAVNAMYLNIDEFRKLSLRVSQIQSGKPILIANFGKEVELKNRKGTSDPNSYESQAKFILQAIESIKKNGIAGGIISSFNDYTTERPSLSTRSKIPYLSTYGIVSEYRNPRTSFDVVSSLYHNESVFALPTGNYSFTDPIFYSITSVILIIVFAYFYNRDRRFRDSVNRSLSRTHNFFVDINSNFRSNFFHFILLLITVSMTFSIIVSSILFHYKNSNLLDAFFSHILISDKLKEIFVYTVWKPVDAIICFFIFFVILFLLITFFIKFLSIFYREKVYFLRVFEIVIWSMLPIILFLPIVMILSRILSSPAYVYPIFILISIKIIWMFQRLLKGISIMYNVFSSKIYILGILFVVFNAIFVYSYYNYNYLTFSYLRYIFTR